jgi:ElaA protein
MPTLTWTLTKFADLSPRELYEALALRQRVFVVEQACAYLDCDGHDASALHLLGTDEGGVLVAYARLLPPGTTYREASIGRVVTDSSVRRSGAGRALMREAIGRARATWGGSIRIGAQRYLERFYGELGFVPDGEPYDEDGIPHVPMVLQPEP